MIRKKVMVSLNGKNCIYINTYRNDGRKYKGSWKNGKQHGEGEFFNPKDNAWKKGVWQEGKRVQWENTDGPASKKQYDPAKA